MTFLVVFHPLTRTYVIYMYIMAESSVIYKWYIDFLLYIL